MCTWKWCTMELYSFNFAWINRAVKNVIAQLQGKKISNIQRNKNNDWLWIVWSLVSRKFVRELIGLRIQFPNSCREKKEKNKLILFFIYLFFFGPSPWPSVPKQAVCSFSFHVIVRPRVGGVWTRVGALVCASGYVSARPLLLAYITLLSACQL